MEQNVSTVLGELRQNHRNMSLMRNLLEIESNHLFDGANTDFELTLTRPDVIQKILDHVHEQHSAIQDCKEDLSADPAYSA